MRISHEHTRGRRHSPTYNSWSMMIQRCTNPKHDSYPRYGGRGIKVCKRWLESFENFLEDMDVRPKGKTLDRVDGSKGYIKSNCRWSDSVVQGNNRSCVTAANFITYKGRTQPVSVWAKEVGIAANVLRARIRGGWTIKAMMTTPVKQYAVRER